MESVILRICSPQLKSLKKS